MLLAVCEARPTSTDPPLETPGTYIMMFFIYFVVLNIYHVLCNLEITRLDREIALL